MVLITGPATIMRIVLFGTIIFILIAIPGSKAIFDDIVHVGCYDLDYSIAHDLHQYVKDPNLEKCSSQCCRLQTKYVGIEAGDKFCYCGNDIVENSRKQDPSLCNVSCSDAESQKCGGKSLMSLYDIKEVEECTENDIDNNIKATEASFLIATPSEVRLYSINDVQNYDVLIETSPRVTYVDYHLPKGLLFYELNNTLYKTTLEPVVTSVEKIPTPLANMSGCAGFAVDWVSDKIFFCDNGSIMSMGLDGDQPSVLYHMPGNSSITRMEVDPFTGILFYIVKRSPSKYWEVHTKGTIESYQYFEPKNFSGVLRSEGVYMTMALDMTAQRVFYVGKSSDAVALFSVNYDGGDNYEHMSIPQLKLAYGMGILNGYFFWSSFVNGLDDLYGVTLPFNGTDSVQRLTSINRVVWHMKVVHPYLQQILELDSTTTPPAILQLG